MNKKLLKNLKEWGCVISFFVIVSCMAFQMFKIPSGSMIPTLLVGDFLIVNKFCYGYSNNSFRIGTFNIPLPKIEKRIFANKPPERGDVVVFRNEKDNDQNYIKRIIGLPGDTIELIKGIVHINGKSIELKEDGEYSAIEDNNYAIYKKYKEILPNGKEHIIIKRFEFGEGRLDNVGPFVVPEEHYFVMGDNRDNSQDSRVMEKVGYVPLNNIMGRAEFIFFSSGCKIYEILSWPFSIRYERILKAIE
ncbi:MAG: signal peptidase I [Holosporales bacterium]|jgi:signal peptidase I|nr:signal peptidase I [Holosporales bacterium]